MAKLSIGARVWFTSKFGDRVTGTYEGDDTAPSINGDRPVHRVKSFDAFGEPSAEPTMCIVPIGSLNLE